MTPEQFHQWVLDQIAVEEHTPRIAAPGVALDLPENIWKAERWLLTQPTPVEGIASDLLYRQAAWLKDYGLSEGRVLDMLEAHSPGYDRDDVKQRVENAYKHGQNEPGAHATSYGVESVTVAEGPPRLNMPIKRWADIRDVVYPRQEWWWQDRCIVGDANLFTGRPKAGKTTLVENLVVTICGGVPLLGKETRKGPVFMLAGEDRYGEIRENVSKIAQSLEVTDEALIAHFTLFSVRSERLPEGHQLIRIEDDGTVIHSAFLVDVIMPHLISLPKPCLWIIDPLAVFVGFNRYNDVAARALVDGFLNDIVEMGITPLITDHPSQASMDDGRNVAGSMQLAAAFPIVATLKADKWKPGEPHRRQQLEMIGSRAAPEGDGEATFYRLKSTPAFSLRGAAGFSIDDHMEKLQRVIVAGYQASPQRLYRMRNQENAHGIEGTIGLAQLAVLDEKQTKAALEEMLARRWIEISMRGKAAGQNVPEHFVPGGRQPKLD